MLDGKRMDELGFLIWTSGRLDTYGKRNKKEQKTLDVSISHMQSFKKQIADSLLFKMLNIPIDDFGNIVPLCHEIARKNVVAFSNANTYDSNGMMIGYLALPRTLTSNQIQTMISILPVFSDFTELSIYKMIDNQNFYTAHLEEYELKNPNIVEQKVVPLLQGVEMKRSRSL